jgi:hypothetical protein
VCFRGKVSRVVFMDISEWMDALLRRNSAQSSESYGAVRVR